jgi:hypothetical protein
LASLRRDARAWGSSSRAARRWAELGSAQTT